MVFKIVGFATLVAVANAGLLPATTPPSYAAPVAKTVAVPVTAAEAGKDETAYEHRPRYSFAYDVHDIHTGDIKAQHESRDGDAVHGSYSLIEADGSRRTVEYTADAVHGFNAVVHREPATVALKAVAAAPVAHTTPVAHASTHAYSGAPVAKIAIPVAHASTHAYSGAPVAKIATPVAHASTHAYYGAPVAKIAAPAAHAPPTLAYASPIVKYEAVPVASHVTYSAPVATYVH